MSDGVKFYKVLGAEGQAIHGGELRWSLPQGDQPGEWHTVTGRIVVCQHGLHLTTRPIHFWLAGSRVFEAEWRGDADQSELERAGSEKIAVREARLLCEVDWGEFCVWFDGEREVHSGEAIAYGSSQVTAYGSSQVTAYNSSQVTAYGSSQVTAYNSSQVTAYNSSQVTSTPYHSRSATVALEQMAVHIDRRDDKTILRGARGGSLEVPRE